MRRSSGTLQQSWQLTVGSKKHRPTALPSKEGAWIVYFFATSGHRFLGLGLQNGPVHGISCACPPTPTDSISHLKVSISVGPFKLSLLKGVGPFVAWVRDHRLTCRYLAHPFRPTDAIQAAPHLPPAALFGVPQVSSKPTAPRS